ncbi:hypothetical protein [Cohnella yongneupensis]|uniref:NIPSNAP domain-containing protein n=1 Tax=Cohnella yongneupensis TaxID=425006 RepID=A0ABW0QZC2_9BACL
MRMIVFCEYVVLEEYRSVYSSWIQSRSQQGKPFQALENTSQPGVFVEIWHAEDGEQAAQIEKERREGRSWTEMMLWIKGGEAGLRIWTFRPIGELNVP